MISFRARGGRPQGCRGKAPYTEKEAKRMALNRERETRLVFAAYKCHHCQMWHIGRIIREVNGIRISEKSTLKFSKKKKTGK